MEITQKIVALKLPEMERKLITKQIPSASNNYTWYNLYSDGYVEQGGVSTTANDTFVTISLPIAMSDTNYVAQKTSITNNSSTIGNVSFRTFAVTAKTTTSFQIFANSYSTDGFNWQVNGYAAESEYIDKIVRREFIAY